MAGWRCIPFAVLLAASIAAPAADSVSVGDAKVSVGDSSERVIESLGPPDRRVQSYDTRKRPIGERWEYDRDGRTFRINVADGRVQRVESGTR